MKRSLQPTSALGWWSFWLSLATLFWARLFLLLPGVLGPLLEHWTLRIPLGVISLALEIALALAAFVVGAAAIRKGQRSWMVLVGLAIAVLVGGFWIFFALDEALSPH